MFWEALKSLHIKILWFRGAETFIKYIIFLLSHFVPERVQDGFHFKLKGRIKCNYNALVLVQSSL